MPLRPFSDFTTLRDCTWASRGDVTTRVDQKTRDSPCYLVSYMPLAHLRQSIASRVPAARRNAFGVAHASHRGASRPAFKQSNVLLRPERPPSQAALKPVARALSRKRRPPRPGARDPRRRRRRSVNRSSARASRHQPCHPRSAERRSRNHGQRGRRSSPPSLEPGRRPERNGHWPDLRETGEPGYLPGPPQYVSQPMDPTGVRQKLPSYRNGGPVRDGRRLVSQ